MKKQFLIGIICIALFSFRYKDDNSIFLLDNDWRFFRGNITGAEKVSFDDSKWRLLDVPHDYSSEDLEGSNSPFDSTVVGGVSTGYTKGGTAWYRRNIKLPENSFDKTFIIQFDGIYMNSNIYFNGELLGNHPYGYTSFWFDISKKINKKGPNIIAVEVKNEGKNSRWYSGSGIYRHVWLRITDKQHICQWGTKIETHKNSPDKTTVLISNKIENSGGISLPVELRTKIINPEGKEVAKTKTIHWLATHSDTSVTCLLNIPQPEEWNLETPKLYKAVDEIYVNGVLKDKVESIFGIRTISYDTLHGFQLNGKTIKLKGGCVHHDNGPLGSRAYDRAEERRVEKLKENGFNAVRCAHNPPSPAFLNACDKLGLLVIDEAFDCWNIGKNPQDYSLYFDTSWKRDLKSMLERDMNHPAIIMWSIGNEIPDMNNMEVVNKAVKLSSWVKTLDSTRPVTAAVHEVNHLKDPFFRALEIAGYNYPLRMEDNYLTDHKRVPNRIVFCTESYPLDAFTYWMAVNDYPWVIGDFVWTGIDNRGEASIGWLGYPQGEYFPWNLAYCGDLDICLWKRPQSYYRDVLWKNGRQLYIFVTPPEPSFTDINPRLEKWSRWNWPDVVADWNWKDYRNKLIGIQIYSGYDEVELFLNAKSLGKKTTNRATKFIAHWEVPYEEGKLMAIGYKDGKEIERVELNSSGPVAKIVMKADRTKIQADDHDLSFIDVTLTDQEGIINPKAQDLVKFEITGPGTIVAVGNSNPKSLESYQLPQRKAWRGKCLVIVKSGKNPGLITLKASVEGINSTSIKIMSHSE